MSNTSFPNQQVSLGATFNNLTNERNQKGLVPMGLLNKHPNFSKGSLYVLQLLI